MVSGTTRIPKVQDILEEVFPQCTLDKTQNPDQIVAQGAAIITGMLSGKIASERIQFTDVTMTNIGMKSYDSFLQRDQMRVMIPKNTPFPFSKTVQFETAKDNQSAVRIVVLKDGEMGDEIKKCKQVGIFNVNNLPPAPAGMITISVTFSIDVNSILKVGAKIVGEEGLEE